MFIRRESFKEYIKKFPITSIILALNVLVFVLMFLTGGSDNHNLLKFGAMYKFSLDSNEYYRLISSMYIHIGLQHFIFNMFTLIVFVCEYERLIGKFKFLLIYTLSGLGASIFVWLLSNSITAGASGAIFGIMGAMFVLMKQKPHLFSMVSKTTLTIILFMNIFSTFIGSGVSVSGHIGGLLTGSLLSYLLIKKQAV